MPPKAAKRKAKAAASDDDDLWGPSSNQPRKKARLSTARTDEESQDTGAKATKQSPSWADWQKKFNEKEKDDKRQFAGVFKTDVEKRREGFLKLISQSTASLNDAGTKHAELFKEACADIEPVAESGSKSARSSPKAAKDSPLFKAGQSLFEKYHKLVTAHEETNSNPAMQVSTQTNDRRKVWEADIEQAEKVVAYAAQYGEKVVRCAIDMSSRDENKMQLLTPPRQGLNGPGQMAMHIHQRTIDTLVKGESTWGEEALMCMEKFESLAAGCAALSL